MTFLPEGYCIFTLTPAVCGFHPLEYLQVSYGRVISISLLFNGSFLLGECIS